MQYLDEIGSNMSITNNATVFAVVMQLIGLMDV